MCLITSQFKAYTPTSEITAYKLVKKATNKENIYYSPFQGAVYDFNSKTSPIQLSTGKKKEPASTNHGNKNSWGGGGFMLCLIQANTLYIKTNMLF